MGRFHLYTSFATLMLSVHTTPEKEFKSASEVWKLPQLSCGMNGGKK